jgi:hypothetical protein
MCQNVWAQRSLGKEGLGARRPEARAFGCIRICNVVKDVVKKMAWIGKGWRGTLRFVPQALEAFSCDGHSAPVHSAYDEFLDFSLKNHRLG